MSCPSGRESTRSRTSASSPRGRSVIVAHRPHHHPRRFGRALLHLRSRRGGEHGEQVGDIGTDERHGDSPKTLPVLSAPRRRSPAATHRPPPSLIIAKGCGMGAERRMAAAAGRPNCSVRSRLAAASTTAPVAPRRRERAMPRRRLTSRSRRARPAPPRLAVAAARRGAAAGAGSRHHLAAASRGRGRRSWSCPQQLTATPIAPPPAAAEPSPVPAAPAAPSALRRLPSTRR